MLQMVKINTSRRVKLEDSVRRKNPKSLNYHLNRVIGLVVGLSGCLYLYFASSTPSQTHVRQAGRSTSSIMVAAHTSAAKLLEKPFLMYGTAWKKESTARLVEQAIKTGFRFIDTACQPRHYNEPGVGAGWSAAAYELGLDRSDLFLQTKFTPIGGQDPNTVPYDKNAPLTLQVQQSLNVSLANLRTSYLDSLVLHSPLPTMEQTMQVWKEMETFVDRGLVHRIGISNCYDYQEFTTLYEFARIKPTVLQNRFYAESNFDTELRQFCKEHDIWYQSFWTLTANRQALATAEAQEWAARKHLTPQTLLYAFLMTLRYVHPLDGTTSQQHMAEDVALMERMQKGEVIFESEDEIMRFAQLLGMPAL